MVPKAEVSAALLAWEIARAKAVLEHTASLVECGDADQLRRLCKKTGRMARLKRQQLNT